MQRPKLVDVGKLGLVRRKYNLHLIGHYLYSVHEPKRYELPQAEYRPPEKTAPRS